MLANEATLLTLKIKLLLCFKICSCTSDTPEPAAVTPRFRSVTHWCSFAIKKAYKALIGSALRWIAKGPTIFKAAKNTSLGPAYVATRS